MKSNYFFIPVALLITASCGGNKNTGDSVSDSIIADTGKVAAFADTVAETDSLSEYLSDDLHKFNLRGNVRKVQTRDYPGFVTCLSGPLDFDKDGKLLSSFSDLTDNSFKTDEAGFITKTYSRESDGTTFNLSFSEFDEDENPIAGKYVSDGPEGIWEVSFTIEYLASDRNGNWTSRRYKGKAVSKGYTDEGEEKAPVTEAFANTENRTITYW